ncbi:Hypothetical protein PBC10988_28890 [Planctomycetales bacterium 10988]|nr:Hypothetical protein PBC10988_28890 [Planctomycetales bacterium 10988]
MQGIPKIMRIALLFGAAVGSCLSTTSLLEAAEVSASIRSKQAFVGFPVDAVIRVSGERQPDLPTIPKIANAEVTQPTGTSRFSSHTWINGRSSFSTTWEFTFQITPLQPGNFQIPALPVRIDGNQLWTQPLLFEAIKSEVNGRLRVEVLGFPEKVYVGQQIPLKLQIGIQPFEDKKLGVKISASGMWEMVSKGRCEWSIFRDHLLGGELKFRDELQRKNENNEPVSYYVFEMTAKYTPQRPGPLQMTPPRVAMEYPQAVRRHVDLFMGARLTLAGTEPMGVQAELPDLQVLPVPEEGRPADYRGAVGAFNIAATASPSKVRVGEAVRLELAIQGKGALEFLPPPPLAELPKLTEGFRVPDEPLAGNLTGSIKTFETEIRPRVAGPQEIPPIPLSYFDPHKETFVTIETSPISLDVLPPDPDAHLQIVRAEQDPWSMNVEEEGPTAEEQAEVVPTMQLQFLEMNPAALTQAPSTSGIAWQWIGLAIPPLTFLGTLLAGGILHWQTHSQNWKYQKAYRHARRTLSKAQSSQEILRALLGYLGSRFQLPPQSVTRTEAMRQWHPTQEERSKAKALKQRLDRLLQLCEQSRYGDQPLEWKNLHREARDCLRQLHRQPLKSPRE